jgi:hypothetical protein
MKHDDYIEWIQLAVLGELADRDRRVLEAHLEECAACRMEFDELTGVMALVGDARAAGPTDHELAEARVKLSEAIQQGLAKGDAAAQESTVWERAVSGAGRAGDLGSTSRAGFAGLIGWLQGGFGRVALAGAAAVAVGIFIGYLAFARAGVQPGSMTDRTDQPISLAQDDSGQVLGPPSYANIKLVDVDPRSGQVRFEYDMVRPVHLKGDIEDERVQRMLAHTVLNEKNPGVKLRAIQTIDAYVEHPEDEEVKTALIQALKTDPSPGVRKHALYVLYKMPFDESIKEACLFVLSNDQNAGMRVAAINILAAATLDGHVTGKEVYDVMDEQVGEDDYMRIRQGAFMQEVNGNGD